jgi:hypothetical protein
MSAFIVSLFFVDLDPRTINENSELAPIFMQNKVKGYSSNDYVKFVKQNQVGMNWYVRGHNYALHFCIYLMIIIVFLKRKKYLFNKESMSIFCFGLLMFCMANLTSSIPSMDRFYLVASIILISSFIYIIQFFKNEIFLKNLSIIFFVPIMIFVIVEVRIGFDFIGLNSVLLNPFLAPFFPDSPALIEYIK